MASRRKPRKKSAQPAETPQPTPTSVAPDGPFDVFLVGPPGLESVLAEEVRALGFAAAKAVTGGVELKARWPDIWQLNLWCRGATRVLVRIAAFRSLHLAQLDKRARRVDWCAFLPKGCAVAVEGTCRKSRIYHAGAAGQRVEAAARHALGPVAEESQAISIRVRIEDDLCTISLDTSGAPLHRRGNKEAVGKAPMRETLAALFLRQCRFTGREPVFDPMCGSGTFLLEAAELAAGLAPGRNRAFAFERFPSLDDHAWRQIKAAGQEHTDQEVMYFGADRDAGAIAMASDNARRAGIGATSSFRQAPISEAAPPTERPGLVIVNPPYGARIGNKKLLYSVYATLGAVLKSRFSGWRVGIVTSEPDLAHATGIENLTSGPPVPHGGLKIRLYQTEPLP